MRTQARRMRLNGPLSTYLRAAARTTAKELDGSLLAFLAGGEAKLMNTFVYLSGNECQVVYEDPSEAPKQL